MSLMATSHRPVLVAEVLSLLEKEKEGIIVDATLGCGGHSRALFESGFEGRLIGIDQDEEALREAQENLRPWKDQVEIYQANFREIGKILSEEGISEVDAFLFDLGVSSLQLDRAERGFSFRHPGPLDMRMSREGQSLADWLNQAEEQEIADVIYRYGEERLSRKIARRIVESRPLRTTEELARIILKVYGVRGRSLRHHPATRTFQALRIFINDELNTLEEGLKESWKFLKVGGLLLVISYHSLEDRIVKKFIKSQKDAENLTRKVIKPTRNEVETNPRARSARLRAARKKQEGA